jgi:hypothetical protein
MQLLGGADISQVDLGPMSLHQPDREGRQDTLLAKLSAFGCKFEIDQGIRRTDADAERVDLRVSLGPGNGRWTELLAPRYRS